MAIEIEVNGHNDSHEDGASRAASGPEADPEALGGLDKDFAQEVFHAGRFGFVEPPRKGECDREGESRGGEEYRVTVPSDPQPVGGVVADGVDEQAPGDRCEAQGDVSEGRVDGKEVVTAHSGYNCHSEARVSHLDQRGQQAHHELQQ